MSSSSSDKEGRKSKGGSSSASYNGNASSGITIRVPHTADPTVDPILCSFPGGLPAALQSTTSVEEARAPHFRIGKHGINKVIKGQDHACEYTAILSRNNNNRTTDLSKQKRPTQMCIGIYDKQTNELILQPTADQGFVFAMTQSVPEYNYQKQQQESANERMTAAESRKALFGDFGSAKKRKVMRSQEANRVNVESVVGAGNMMDTVLQSMSESNRQAMAAGGNNSTSAALSAADQATLAWRKQFLPEYDENAQEAYRVYSAKKIAGPTAWSRLGNKVGKCLEQDNVLAAIVEGPPSKQDVSGHQGQDEEAEGPPVVAVAEQRRRKDVWYPSIVRLLKMLVPKGQAAKQQLVCAVLLNHFLHLHVQLHKKRYIPPIEADRHRFFGAPTDVGQRWIECFTTPMAGRDGTMGHVMSKANKDSCCVHLFLLLLMAEGGNRMRSDGVQHLADDLQMDPKDASHLLCLAGCSVKRKSVRETSAVLTVPLKFPTLGRANRR